MRSWVVLVVVGWGAGCGGDDGPGASAGSTGEGTGSAATGTETAAPTGGEEVDRGECGHYLECIAATTPAALPGVAMGFGEDGTCWQGGADEAQLCREACATGLAQTRELFPDAVECRGCAGDDDCAADESCNRGDCVADGVYCGNGRVEDGESCDRSPGCSASCDGAPCAPLTGDGCSGAEKCVVADSQVGCSENHGTVPVDGSCSGLFVACAPGLTCGDPGDPEKAYCAALCDRYGEAPCPSGGACVGYAKATGYTLPEIFDYVGVCL